MPSRCDALQYACRVMLEQHRALLDGPTKIQCVSIDLKLTPDHRVRAATLSPELTSHPVERPEITRYEFLAPERKS